MKYLILALLVWSLVSCHDDCDPEDTRCSGNMAQICASDGDWQTVDNCSLVEPGEWECCEWAFIYEDAETAACIPLGECE